MIPPSPGKPARITPFPLKASSDAEVIGLAAEEQRAVEPETRDTPQGDSHHRQNPTYGC